MKKGLIIISLALLVCLIVLGSRPDERLAESPLDASRGPAFVVEVEKPRMARPLFGLLPEMIEVRMSGDGDLIFDNASPGAEIGSVGLNRLELRADGWDLVIETDGGGSVTSGTQLVFQLMLANKQRRLRCQPADQATGFLSTSTPAGTAGLDGRFLVELATCENTATGKTIEWPPAPLTVRGRFEELPLGER